MFQCLVVHLERQEDQSLYPSQLLTAGVTYIDVLPRKRQKNSFYKSNFTSTLKSVTVQFLNTRPVTIPSPELSPVTLL